VNVAQTADRMIAAVCSKLFAVEYFCSLDVWAG